MIDMPIIHVMKGSSFELNHTRALHHLLEEAHVARAARKLGITPAAASNALRRLRADLVILYLFDRGERLHGRLGPRSFVRRPRRSWSRQRGYSSKAVRSTQRRHLGRSCSRRLTASPSCWFLGERAPRAQLPMRTTTVDIAAFLRDRRGEPDREGR